MENLKSIKTIFRIIPVVFVFVIALWLTINIFSDPPLSHFGIVFNIIMFIISPLSSYYFFSKTFDNCKYKTIILSILFTCWIFFISLKLHSIIYSSNFCDESEKFTLGYFASNGIFFYRDVFYHHGPIPAIIQHIFYSFFPINNFAFVRTPALLLFFAPILCFIYGNFLKNKNERFTSVIIYLTLLTLFYHKFLPGVFTYQAIGGIFLGISYLLIFPFFKNETPSKKELFLSGFLTACTFFTAISFSIAIFFLAVLIFICTLKNFKNFSMYLFGGLVATTLILTYLFIFSSITGFIEQHILFNFKIYQDFVPSRTWYSALTNLKYAFLYPTQIEYIFPLSLFLSSLSLFIKMRIKKNRRYNLFLLTKIILILLIGIFCAPVGNFGCHAQGLFFFSIILIASVFTNQSKLYCLLILAFCNIYYISNYNNTLATVKASADFIGPDPILQKISNPDDRVLFFSLEFEKYFTNKRLPASFYYFYLPWIEEFMENTPDIPNVVSELKSKKKQRIFVYFDEWAVWDRYNWGHDYGKAINNFVKRKYRMLPNINYYLSPQLYRDIKKQNKNQNKNQNKK